MLNLPMNLILIAIAVVIGLAAVLRLVMKRRPAIETATEGETGHIAPDRALLTVICLVGVALAGAALVAFFRGTAGLPVLVVAATALVMTGLMLAAFFPFYDILWNEDGIEGPAFVLPPPFGPKRSKMFWEDIDRVTQEHGRHWVLEDRHGNRIMWSFIYKGRPALMARIADECPWLFAADTPAGTPSEVFPPVKRRFIKLNFATAKSA